MNPRPGDPCPDPGDNPRSDGVASKPDATPGKQEQGKGLGPQPTTCGTNLSPDARDLSSRRLKRPTRAAYGVFASCRITSL
jgi:hypothetical protein